jgi:hypothetical protein
MPTPLPVVLGRPTFFGVSVIDFAICLGYHKSKPRGSSNFRPGSNPEQGAGFLMPKANRVHSTPRRTAPLRKTAATLRSARPQALPTIDPEPLPDIYCMGLDGDCLAPLIPDRAAVMIKKSEPFGVGDVVCIWFRPEIIQAGRAAIMAQARHHERAAMGEEVSLQRSP